MSDRLKALEILEKLTDPNQGGYNHEEILDYVIKNFLPGHIALEAMESAQVEFPLPFDDDADEVEEDEDDKECPECMGNLIIDYDYDYDTASKIYKCEDCGNTFS